MKKQWIALLSALLCVLALAACKQEYGPPPDLRGKWTQTDAGDWYFTAIIKDDTIRILWYLPREKRSFLYWDGTFTPPENDKEPYSWKSDTLHTKEVLDSSSYYSRATREEQKTFTYKDGKIGFIVTSGHLQMGYTLERVTEEGAADAPPNG